ncbi:MULTISPECIES: DUF3747 domain-containing protein [Aphanothece]|uniref:DUF3747 domain-containing protein n=1 Tax=Aphanothece TaxID=1121 RepID=UPI00398558AF
MPFRRAISRQPSPSRSHNPSHNRIQLRTYLAVVAGCVGATAAVLGTVSAERVQASGLFGSQPIAEGQAIALAQPLAGNRWNLIVLEQLQPEPPCWRRFPDGTVITYDTDVPEGVCGRYLSSSAYSLRAADTDLANPWRLRVEQANGRLQLMASNPQQSTLIPVASGPAPASGLAELTLAPGWSFQRRTYGEEALRHLYMAHAEPLPVLLARARGGGDTLAMPAVPPPPSIDRPGSRTLASLDRPRRGLTSRTSPESSGSRLSAETGVIALQVVPYRP